MGSIGVAAMHHAEMVTARAAQALGNLYIGFWGEVFKYRPEDHVVQVRYGHASDSPTNTQWIPLLTPWGSAGYGDQCGPEVGAQVLVLQLAPDGDDVVAIGFGYNDVDWAPGKSKTYDRSVQGGERVIVDKRGSFVSWSEDGPNVGDGKWSVRIAGTQYASLVAPAVELGAENLDPEQNAVMTKADGDALAANILAAVSTWAGLHVQPGSGAPPIEQQVHATGSDVVKAAP